MNVFEKIAKLYGVPEQEVREEMKLAIKAGFESPNPQAQENWEKLFPNGKEPTPEEFIKVISNEVKTKRGC